MRVAIATIAGILWIATSLAAAEPQLLVEDSFAGKLGEGWSWLREAPEAWRIKDHALEIRVQPGDAGSVKNALLRKLPDRGQGRLVVEVTVTNTAPPIQQYEQGGLTFYQDGKPLFKLVKEFIDGKLYLVLGGPTDPEGKPGLVAKVPLDKPTARLRLILSHDRYWGEFQPEAQGEFQKLGTGPLPAPGDEQISLQCYQGPPDAEHWIRFSDFRLQRTAE